MAVAGAVIEVLALLLGQAGRWAIYNAAFFLADAVVALFLTCGAGAGIFRVRRSFAAAGHGVGIRDGIANEGIKAGCFHS